MLTDYLLEDIRSSLKTNTENVRKIIKQFEVISYVYAATFGAAGFATFVCAPRGEISEAIATSAIAVGSGVCSIMTKRRANHISSRYPSPLETL